MGLEFNFDSSTSVEFVPDNATEAAEAKQAYADYEKLYEAALQTLQSMLGTAFTPQGTSPAMDAQSASGALASYMHENGINSLNPNQLYQLAYNPSSGTPDDVSDAAKFMLQNPDVFNQIETHDVAGSDGIAGVNDFDWAAQGGLDSSTASQPDADDTDLPDTDDTSAAGGMTTQSASGALSAYMHGKGLNSLNPNQLYQLAYNPSSGTPDDVSQAAKFMLQNPDVFNQIETHDVAGSDGIAGVNDFDWAAQGGLDSSAVSQPDSDDTNFPDTDDTSAASGMNGMNGMTTQSASGALAAYMHENGINSLNPNQLYQLAYNPSSGTPDDVCKAAKFMLQHPDVFNQIETHDVAGSDGIAGVNDFDWAAQGGLDGSTASEADSDWTDFSDTDDTSDASDFSGMGGMGGMAGMGGMGGVGSMGGMDGLHGMGGMTAQSASGALAAYLHENGIGSLNPNSIYQLAFSKGTPTDVSKAAKFMLRHSEAFNQIETHDVAGSDGIAGVNDFDWAAQGGLAAPAA